MGSGQRNFRGARVVLALVCAALTACADTQSQVPTVDPRTRVAPPPTFPPTVAPTSLRPTVSPLVPTSIRPTPPLIPTATPPFIPTATPPFGTPDVHATSTAVILTVTAQYFTLTPPPRVPTRGPLPPVGAGPKATNAPPTLDADAVTLLTAPERVSPGGAAALAVQTKPGALCAVVALHEASEQPIPGVPARLAGSDGVAAWLWTVDALQPEGVLNLRVECGNARASRLQIRVEK